ncbi:hypothetical protein [Methanimicrococcus hongohii]|uniref:hypothetical protein n=1 Tax=Methanimicrococcus hongohii TaxID=3028295 RepID=UPI00292DEC25|nr:hypothetical protein [Methanimicrococcus sp. Hf6]
MSAPAEPANLQLSFAVAACNQVCVSAAIFRFVFPLLPSGLRLPIRLSLRQQLPLPAAARAASFFSHLIENRSIVS